MFLVNENLTYNIDAWLSSRHELVPGCLPWGSYSAEKTPQYGEKLLYEYYCSLRDEPHKIPDMGSQKLFS